ncbi:hypothetical protein EXM22_13900 [Oceanispirochaeta crateris]|uniref:Uncharacterized protein n=1 Tax=Oceanispirochaeta crateris TaxID=2518645 RepID=A0A5C1QP68_9SPIO|nr:hypothetical protein [Oceanispirochaeta crateris]QEN09029.1 hypothetical protein EXM22_13900 [Oceanispirochaeta crateris]
MIQSGIDEAGLGPVLGPYCAALVSLEYSGEYEDPRKSCSSILSKEPDPQHLAVGDSKKIYTSGKLESLERTVLAFYELYTEQKALHAKEFIEVLSGHNLSVNIPWYKDLETLALPLSHQRDDQSTYAVQSLQASFKGAGITINTIDLTVQPALSFNSVLKKQTNKASACQEILSPLLLSGIYHSDRLIVDRQGGRRYYGDWLVSLFPGKRLSALRELKELSRYDLEDCLIDFQVKADALCFETALASMFAKYSREICMTAFNRYWSSRLPEIKHTAGYYKDGHRFIQDLKEKDCFPKNPDLLLRRK